MKNNTLLAISVSITALFLGCATTKATKCEGGACAPQAAGLGSGLLQSFDYTGASDYCSSDSKKSTNHPMPDALRREYKLRHGSWSKIRIEEDMLGLSLQDALVTIQENTGILINAGGDADGIVATPVKGMRLIDGLSAIVRSNGADWSYDSHRKVLYVAGTYEGALGRQNILSTYVTKAKFLDAKTIRSMVEPSYRHYITVDDESGRIKVVAPNGILARIYEEIKTVDRQPSQVLLNLSIYEIDHAALVEWGRSPKASDLKSAFSDPIVELSRASGQVVLGGAATNVFLSGLRALSAEGKASVVSSPKAITIDGNTAEFMTTETLIDALQAVNTSRVINHSRTGTTLREITLRTGMKVRPIVLPDDRLKLEIKNAESGSLVDESSLRIKRHKLSTEVIMRSGKTLLLGGAIYEKKIEEESGVPFLKDIWVLGSLFSYKDKEKKKVKVIFSIQPKILECQPKNKT